MIISCQGLQVQETARLSSMLRIISMVIARCILACPENRGSQRPLSFATHLPRVMKAAFPQT